MRLHRNIKELGSGGVGIAACMLVFSLVYFSFYLLMAWIYDTKESRRFGVNHHTAELRVITKEEVMKFGIGTHVFKCYGLFTNGCVATELYGEAVDS